MNILFVGAHHDDLEVSIGGSVRRWVDEGHKVCSVILTNSQWTSPDGKINSPKEKNKEECNNAAKLLGYKPYNFMACDDFKLIYDDKLVSKLLKVINKEKIDKLITIWPYDAHPTHREASKIALAASRKIPKIILVKISWNIVPQSFNPNLFIDITNYLGVKLQALRCYKEEFERTGELWEKEIRSNASSYGIQSGFNYAEAYQIIKYCK